MLNKKLYLAWQDPTNRRWIPVGILAKSEKGNYFFFYTEGARTQNFKCLGNMKDLEAVYVSTDLFPLFSNRLLSTSRPEFKNYLNWLNIKDADPFTILALTEGARSTDNLEVFGCPVPNQNRQYEMSFLAHGMRYLPETVMDRIMKLEKGESLYLIRDDQNKYDSMAMALRTGDPVQIVGYCPRYLSPDFRELLNKNRMDDIEVTVEQVNTEAPLNMRLLCKIVAPWPQGFAPCSGPSFSPIIQLDEEILNKIENQRFTPQKIAHPV